MPPVTAAPANRRTTRPRVVVAVAVLASASLAQARGDDPGSPPASASAGPSAPDPPVAPAAPGAITGQVTRSSADPRPAAGVVVIFEDGAGAQRQVETGDDGALQIAGLAPGTYVITALGAGGEQATQRIEVGAGATAEARLALEIEAGAETIVVRGLTEASRRRQSAEAVTVVETARARRETVDLGEVLARTQGVGVRRGGGLGSDARVSLGGLSGEQIRVFLDGVPLELAGFPFGVANVPVNLIDRIEVYSGVVPIRFGADALGGGINLVTEQNASPGSHGGASYQVGSFGTDRATLTARHLDATSGMYARIDGLLDHARNNYPVDVEVADEHGHEQPARLPLFHDRYTALGGAVELGVVDRPWARRLALRGFGSGFDKQVQSDPSMARIYGDVSYGERTAGGSARYQQALGGGVAIDAVAGYVFTRGALRDVSTCRYDWYGNCFATGAPGEIDTRPHDQRTWQHTGFARLDASWALAPGHRLALSVAPSYATRSGHERRDAGLLFDPLSGERRLFGVVSGFEYQVELFGDRLENIAFAKHYLQRLNSETPQPGGLFMPLDRDTQRPGFGDGLRYRFAEWLYAKASYEWATRLPRPAEVFGDNVFIAPSFALVPETSHNVNAGLTVDGGTTAAGAFSATATGFLRESKHLIALFGADHQSYQNVSGARAVGVDAAAAWTSPGDYLSLDGNFTYQDVRNTSSDGVFGAFDGVRIPNQPYLFGGGAARFMLRDVVVPRDQLVLSATSRYVHAFYRSWENLGLASSKDQIAAQLVHGAGVSYLARRALGTVTVTLEVDNLSDAKVFDFYGLQRPGRGVSLKSTLEF